MECTITKTGSASIESFRKLFLQELNNQFIYDKCHYYGWADCYLFSFKETEIGYAAVWGTNDRSIRDSLFEFYILPPYRRYTDAFFSLLLSASDASVIECQSNDLFLYALLCRYADTIKTERILFEEHIQTNIEIPGVLFRKRTDADNMSEDDGDHVLECNGTVVAHGGLLLNYNFPYADVYMHVLENHRQKGYGSFIVQELKKLAYSMGRVPAARCTITNSISKATLEKAGFTICGFIQTGTIKNNQ